MSKFLDALTHSNRGRPPIWIMRQAGRYLPSYQQLRARYPLYTLFTEPDLIAKVTELPLQAYPFDAAILFSDITLVALSLGLTLTFQEGPRTTGIPKAPSPAAEALPFLAPAILALKKTLAVPLIGFVGSPYTVSTYLNFCPLEPLTAALIDLIDLQIDAGVDALQIFESHPHPPSHPYLQQLIDHARKRNIPTILFARDASLHPHTYASFQPTALSLDEGKPLATVRQSLALPLQGNLASDLLLDPLTLSQPLDALLDSMKGDPAWIFNLGHGIRPATPLASIDLIFNRLWQM